MPGLDPVVFLSPSSIGTAIEITVADINSPTELNSVAASSGDIVIARTVSAATDQYTYYIADTTSDAQSLPWIVSSSTSGVKFIASAGHAVNNSVRFASTIRLNSLTASRIVTLDSNKDSATPATVTTDQSVALTGSATLNVAGLTASRLLRTDSSKNLESNAALTNTRLTFADSNGWPTDSANLTFASPTLTLSGRQDISQGTITDPATALAIASTWNDAADTFAAFTVNITNTNSAAASTLANLLVGGSSQFFVRRNGNTGIGGNHDPFGRSNTLALGLSSSGSAGFHVNAATGNVAESNWGVNATRYGSLVATTTQYNFQALNGADLGFGTAGTLRWVLQNSDSALVGSETTNATSSATGAFRSAGGGNFAANLLHRQGRGAGVTSTATAAGTTTLTATSTEIQTFTGTTTQTVQFPAANLFGTGIAVLFTINNQSTGTVTPTRAGSDTFQGGGTTDPVLAGASQSYASNGVSVWLKV